MEPNMTSLLPRLFGEGKSSRGTETMVPGGQAIQETPLDGIEVLGKTLDSLFPPMCANEADYAFLLEDLCRFDIRTKEDLIFLVRKHWTALIREQDELSELMRKATEGCMPFCNDLSYSRTGLVRVALYLEFGQSWCEYVHRLPFRG